MTNLMASSLPPLEVNQAILVELRALAVQMRARDENIELQFNTVTKQIEEVKKVSEESSRALRGTNGETGIVGRVRYLEREISSVTRLLSEIQKTVQGVQSHPCYFEDRIVALEKGPTQSKGVTETDMEKMVREATDPDHVLRWEDIRNKIAWPLVFLLLVAVMGLLVAHGINPMDP